MKQEILCSYCGVTGEEELGEAVKKLKNCTNCIADIFLKGQWTGHGFKAISKLITKYGLDEVNRKWQEIKREEK